MTHHVEPPDGERSGVELPAVPDPFYPVNGSHSPGTYLLKPVPGTLLHGYSLRRQSVGSATAAPALPADLASS